MSEYPVGQTIRITGTFRDVDSALVTPSTITLKVRKRINANTYTEVLSKVKADLTAASTGVYYYDYTPSEAGDYFYRFTSTGTSNSTHTDQEFIVLASVLVLFSE